MCVEGLRAIPLGCSDCYDKGNVTRVTSRKRSAGWAALALVAGPGQGQGLPPAGSARGASDSAGLRNGSLARDNCPQTLRLR